MISWMNEIFGTYTPVTTEVMTSQGAITVVANGMAGVDWRYIGSIAIFITFLYCIFRIVGSLFSRS